ncbi:MAG: YCF48-related protein [Candidatus Acidiferrales bacterium]
MASREEDKAIAGLLQKSLAADSRPGASANVTSAAGKDCPEPEILAAYFDRALEAQETARYDLHFSQCAHCRAQLAAMARASADTEGDKKSASAWNWERTPAWLMPAAAAFALLVVITAITLHKQHASQLANELAMSRSETVLPPAPQSRTSESPAPAEPALAAPTPPSALTEIPRDKTSFPASTPDKFAEQKGLQALALNAQKKFPGAPKPSRLQNAPAAAAPPSAAPSTDENAIVLQAPPSTRAENAEVAPRKSASDLANADTASIEVTPEAAAKHPSASKAKGATHTSASAPSTGANGSHAVAGANFAAHNALQSAARARMQQMQLASNLSGLTVRTPDSNVLWLVSDGGDVGRSEDGGATWKFTSLGLRGLFVSGSAPTTKICWLLGEHGAIFRTTDGKTWTAVPLPAAADDAEFEHIEAKDESNATVTAADGQELSTSDGGKTWTPAK